MENKTLPPEMMEKIMGYCSAKTLKSFRLVSKSCRDWSKKLWQASTAAHVLVFNSNIFVTPEDKKLQFINFVRPGEQLGIPHQFVNFVVKGHHCFGEHDQLHLLLNTCGAQIKMLTLDAFCIPNIYEFQYAIFSASFNMEQLIYSGCTVLSLSGEHWAQLDWTSFPVNRNVKSFRICNTDFYQTPPQFWKEQFKVIPSLEDFSIHNTSTMPGLIENMFGAICLAREEDCNMLKLKKISIKNESVDVEDSVPPALLEFLRSPDIKLEKLTVITKGGEGSSQLTEILTRQRGSLKSLELGGFVASHLDKTSVCCNPLENLKELRLHSRIFPNLAILSLVPNLEKLVIAEYSKYGPCLVLETVRSPHHFNIHLPKCSHLEFGNFLTAKRMQVLIDWIPNVTKLKIPKINDAFSVVCSHWTNLVSIEIPNSKLDGQGITGLDRDDVLRINSGSAEARTATVPRANISCLKHLKRFTIGDNHGMIVPQLGLCSIQFGFQQLPLAEGHRFSSG